MDTSDNQRVCRICRGGQYALLTSTLIVSCDTQSGKGAESDDSAPNIILIVADDLGYADLGCQGSADVKTPNIDKLAECGIRFTDGYTTAPQSGPSRTGLLSGHYQNSLGVEINADVSSGESVLSVDLMPEYLKRCGYTTAMMGKWGIGNNQGMRPTQRGFDYSFWNSSGGIYYTPLADTDSYMFYRNEEAVGLGGVYSTDAIGVEALQFIEENYSKRFFVFLPFVTPHLPREAKLTDLALFSDAESEERCITLAMIKALDDNVGYITSKLKELGIKENTLIIFISDNGGYDDICSYNTPLNGTKSQLLEGGIRVPFIMQWEKRFQPNQLYSHPVIATDLLPTMIAAATKDDNYSATEDGLDGKNLIPYLTSQRSDAPHDTLYWRFYTISQETQYRSNRAIREGDWKLVRNGNPVTKTKLYNLDSDIGETTDLIDDYPDKVQELKDKWNVWNENNPTIEGFDESWL